MKKIKFFFKKHKINSYQISAFGIFFLAIYLILNIVSSQVISPLYPGIAEGNKNDAVSYLKKIRSTANFDKELRRQELIHGVSINDLVFEDELAIGAQIKKFEQLLEKNKSSRDILYGLYLLYKEKGDDNAAKKYLDLVKDIDPNFQ